MRLSSRIATMDPSPTLAVKEQAAELRNQGRSIIDLSAGDPDFDTPDHIKEAAREAIAENFTHYTAASGILPLKEAVVEQYNQRYERDYGTDEVIISVGAKHALYNIMMVLVQEGDEVLIPSPYWVSYPAQVRLAGAKSSYVTTTSESGFSLQASQVEAEISDSTEVLLLNSPNNPTGAIIERDELQRIHQVCLDHGVTLVYDECYGDLIYEDEHVSAAELPQEDVVIVNSVSKTYAMTGWRIGYTLGPPEVIGAMGRLQSHSTSNPCSISQKAAVAALKGPKGPTREMVEQLDRRRKYLLETLKDIGGLKFTYPRGAFYLWLDISELMDPDENSSDFAQRLLSEVGVATVPGGAFGEEGYIRLSYAKKMEQLKEGISRLEEFASRQ